MRPQRSHFFFRSHLIHVKERHSPATSKTRQVTHNITSMPTGNKATPKMMPTTPYFRDTWCSPLAHLAITRRQYQ